jgi:O-phosphoseryl-tRNA(Cys) synthetase
MAKDDKATKKAAAKKLAETKAAAKKAAEKKAAAKKLADKKLAKKLADKKAAAKKAAKKLADKVAAATKLAAQKAKSPKPERAEVPAVTGTVAEVAPVVETIEAASSDEAVGPTRRELLVQAGQLGIVGRHRMSKVDLEAAVAAH